MERFFSKRNTINNLSKSERNKFANHQEAFSAFSRTNYPSYYIIDYEKQKFDYVSDNPLFLCGNSAEKVRQMGYAFYTKHVPQEDLELLLLINKIGFDFFEKIPIEDRKFYIISYDFHLKKIKNRPFLVNQKLTPLQITENGKIWKALCTVSPSTAMHAGNVRIHKKASDQYFEYDQQGASWKSKNIIQLSERELEILQLTIRGFTIMEIADKIFVSMYTVKFHRKKILEKMDVKNMPEAILYAVNNKLF